MRLVEPTSLAPTVAFQIRPETTRFAFERKAEGSEQVFQAKLELLQCPVAPIVCQTAVAVSEMINKGTTARVF